MSKFSINAIELFDELYDPKTSRRKRENIKKIIETSPELKIQLREYNYLSDTVKSAGKLLLKEKLDIIHSEFLKKSSADRHKTTDLKERALSIFEKYFSPYMDLVTVRNSSEKDDFKKAMEFYSAKKYKEAFERLSKLSKADPENILVLFYAGISSLSSGDAKISIKFFNKIIRSKNQAFKNIILWYISLASLHQGNYQKAIGNLIKIDKSSAYYKKANSLLKKLDEVLDN